MDEADSTSVGYLHPLSKRTELYAVGMYDGKDGSPAGHAYSVGMRTRF